MNFQVDDFLEKGKAAANLAKNFVLNYTETEIKVREATNNDHWGPSGTVRNNNKKQKTKNKKQKTKNKKQKTKNKKQKTKNKKQKAKNKKQKTKINDQLIVVY